LDALKGPTKNELEDLEASLENGYICGNSIQDNNNDWLCVRRVSRCGDYIEYQYYNPNTGGLKGGRILTPDICAICYDTDDIVSADEICKERDMGGKNPLLVCRYCFDKNIEMPCSGGRSTTMKEKKDQGQRTKKRQLDESVQQGHRKERRSS
jgi:hypothetical protein